MPRPSPPPRTARRPLFDTLSLPPGEADISSVALGDDYAVLGTSEGGLHLADLAGDRGGAPNPMKVTAGTRLGKREIRCLSACGDVFAVGGHQLLTLWRVRRRAAAAGGQLVGAAQETSIRVDHQFARRVVLNQRVCACINSGTGVLLAGSLTGR